MVSREEFTRLEQQLSRLREVVEKHDTEIAKMQAFEKSVTDMKEELQDKLPKLEANVTVIEPQLVALKTDVDLLPDFQKTLYARIKEVTDSIEALQSHAAAMTETMKMHESRADSLQQAGVQVETRIAGVEAALPATLTRLGQVETNVHAIASTGGATSSTGTPNTSFGGLRGPLLEP